MAISIRITRSVFSAVAPTYSPPARSGIPEEDLGKFDAQRTILKREVLPEAVANAASVLTGPDLSHTAGLHLPVDARVAAAFLR